MLLKSSDCWTNLSTSICKLIYVIAHFRHSGPISINRKKWWCICQCCQRNTRIKRVKLFRLMLMLLLLLFMYVYWHPLHFFSSLYPSHCYVTTYVYVNRNSRTKGPFSSFIKNQWLICVVAVLNCAHGNIGLRYSIVPQHIFIFCLSFSICIFLAKGIFARVCLCHKMTHFTVAFWVPIKMLHWKKTVYR